MTHYHFDSKNFQPATLSTPGSGFGARGSRFNSKRLSVALPPEVASISENSTELPTPRTSRSHLLAGLRTQPKTPAVPASAPYHQTQHQLSGLHASQWADPSYGYQQAMPQSATAAGFEHAQQYATRAGQQMYSARAGPRTAITVRSVRRHGSKPLAAASDD